MFLVIVAFVGCGDATNSSEGGKTSKGSQKHYKSTMEPVDQLAPAERIIILQNVFNPDTREGFYSRETRPAAAEIQYNAGTVAAWPVSQATEFLHKCCAGTVSVTKTDGSKAEFSAEEFRGMYAIFDFRSDAHPILYNPTTKSTVTGFTYAVTAEGEVIYSVVSGSYHNANELLARVGWKTDATYRFVATDKFYVPVDPASAVIGELRGGLSGTVNGSFPDLDFANGKINDVLYIELVVE